MVLFSTPLRCFYGPYEVLRSLYYGYQRRPLGFNVWPYMVYPVAGGLFSPRSYPDGPPWLYTRYYVYRVYHVYA